MTQALLGLGSNIEPRREHLRLALEGLRGLGLQKVSSLYETEPMDVLDQAPFLNMGAALETSLEPLELLDALQRIEAQAKKKVTRRRGPRTLDLDLWSHGEGYMESPRLSLPHPRLSLRPFVLIPLEEIAPDWRHPRLGLSAREMLELLPKPWPEVKNLGTLT